MQITLLAHDIRSTHNVGAFFRTCDGLGVEEIIFSGYTPYPTFKGDARLPHFADKITRQIHKTALGAESTVDFKTFPTLADSIAYVRAKDAVLIALEQYPGSLTPAETKEKLRQDYKNRPLALLLGNEIHGVDDAVLKEVDIVMEIPMQGTKESFNVSVAAGIALYTLATL